MKKYIVTFSLMCLMIITALSAGSKAAKPEAETVLDNMEAVGHKLNSLVATLWQQKTNTQLGIQEPAESGKLYYLPAKNGSMKLRIDITKPAKTIVVAGDMVKFYQPEVHQLLVTTLKNGSKNQSLGSLAVT